MNAHGPGRIMKLPTGDRFMSSPLSQARLPVLRSAFKLDRRRQDARLAHRHEGPVRAAHTPKLLLQDDDDTPQRDVERPLDMAFSGRKTQRLGATALALRSVGCEAWRETAQRQRA